MRDYRQKQSLWAVLALLIAVVAIQMAVRDDASVAGRPQGTLQVQAQASSTSEAELSTQTAPDTEETPAVEALAPEAGLPPLPAAIAPHRAPAAMRQQDRQRLRDDPNLTAYAAELQSRANAGDADAAMLLSDLHGLCGMAAEWGGGKTDFTAHELDMQAVSGFSPAQTEQWKSFLLTNGRRCAQWRSQSLEEWSNLAAAWRARADQLGHPGAWFAAHLDLGLDPASAELLERARPYALELLRQRDLDEMVRYADQLAPLSPYDGLGFVMAACLLNEACAPDPVAYAESRIAAGDMVAAGAYWPLSYSGPRAVLMARRQAEEIITLWSAGRFELILSGRGSDMPGGG